MAFLAIAIVMSAPKPPVAIAGTESGVYYSTNCQGITNPNPSFGLPGAGQAVCFDSTLNMWFEWNGTAFQGTFVACEVDATLSGGPTTIATPACATGATRCVAAPRGVATPFPGQVACQPTAGYFSVVGSTAMPTQAMSLYPIK